MPINALIADDSKFARLQLRGILGEAGYKVIAEASNGDEAVYRYKEHKPDVVFMDLAMPVKNGLVAIKEIIEFDSKAVIIVCSAIGHRGAVAEAVLSGAKDFILKPINKEQILTVLERQLKKGQKKEEVKKVRQHYRFDIKDLKVRYKPLHGAIWKDGTAENISTGGVLFRPQEELPPGTLLMIELSCGKAWEEDNEPIIIMGKTVRREKKIAQQDPAQQDPDGRYGIEFVELSDTEQQKLQEFIKFYTTTSKD